MRRLSFGSASCYSAAIALLGLAWMAVCRFIVTHTPPGGVGEMKGIDHLGWNMTIMLLLLIPLIGFTWVLFRPSPVMLLVITGVITTVLTLVLLRFVKGAFIGYLWAKNEQDRGA